MITVPETIVIWLVLVAINAYGYSRQHYDRERKAGRDVRTVKKWDSNFLSTWGWWVRQLLMGVCLVAWTLYRS